MHKRQKQKLPYYILKKKFNQNAGLFEEDSLFQFSTGTYSVLPLDDFSCCGLGHVHHEKYF